jgi:hypothetical protein
MYKVTPSAPLSQAPTAAAHTGNCGMLDASTLLYQPALRRTVIQEQLALLATRLAVARWTSGNIVAPRADGDAAPPFRAAFYAREQDNFFAWIARGGVWDDDAAPVPADTESTSDFQ